MSLDPECVLIVGATRPLGAALARQFWEAYGDTLPSLEIDLLSEHVEAALADKLHAKGVDGKRFSIKTMIIMTGYLADELSTLHAYPPYWMAEQRMYTTTAIAPVLVIKMLVTRKVFTRSTTPNIVLVTTCACSIAHGGATLQPQGVIVSVVHPGCLYGPNQSWDGGHGIMPDQAAVSLIEWMEDLTMEHSGQFWAPMG